MKADAKAVMLQGPMTYHRQVTFSVNAPPTMGPRELAMAQTPPIIP